MYLYDSKSMNVTEKRDYLRDKLCSKFKNYYVNIFVDY